MTWYNNNQTITLEAAADLSGSQYHLVVCDSNGLAALAGDGATNVIGVLQNKPGQGEAAAVMVVGVTKVVASAAITAGDQLASTANADVETAATTGDGLVGVALTAAGGAGEVITMLIRPNGTQA